MTPTGFLYIPDALAMLVLMAILFTLRRQSGRKDVGWWLLGLSFILAEALSSDAYRANLHVLHTPSHVTALGSFVFAGLTFGWVARRDSLPHRTCGSFCLVVTMPLLALTILYGANIHDVRPFVVTLAVAALAQTVWMAAFLRRLKLVLIMSALETAGWGPILWLVLQHNFRGAVYWGVGYLYLLVAAALWSMVSRSSIGGGVVVGGFVVWAGCLIAHPLVATLPVANSFVDQVWTLQKFFVTIGLLLVLLDEERKHNRELALYDVLTGLPNRRLFDDRFSQAIARTNRSHTPFALFVLDLNNFKSINDQLGHAQGDIVLRDAANALAGVVRTSDTLARFGGDEFVILVNEVTEPGLCPKIAGQLRAALNGIALSGSVGYALYPTDAADRESLQELADARMYEQKESGLLLTA